MIRWKYVVPRLVLLLVVTVVLWISLEPLLRWSIIYGGQRLTGTLVEIGAVTVRLARSQLALSDLRVVDPEDPSRNLFEAERILLDIENKAALRRKLIVRTGRVEGIRLFADRDEAAELPDLPAGADDEDGSLMDQARDRGKAWLQASTDKLQEDLENDLHTVKLARELRERWPHEYAALRQRGRRIDAQGKQLQRQVEQILEDPLQNIHQVQPLVNRVDQLRNDVVQTRTKLAELRKQMQADRRAVIQAKEHDVAYVRQKLHVGALDAESLNEYLLGPVWSDRIEMAVRWIQRSRGIASDESATSDDGVASRGISIIFPGYHATPDLLIRQLLMSGTGTVEGSDFSFEAIVADLSHQPRRHARPVTVNFKADGGMQLLAQAVMDRRAEKPMDRFLVDIPAVNQSAQTLGDPDELAVELGAGVAKIKADLQVNEQKLDGWITIRQPHLQLKPVLSKRYAQLVSAESLAGFSQVDQMNAKVLIRGTLTKPRWKLQSNLGPQLASVLNSAVRHELSRREAELLNRGQQLAQEQLDDLERQLVTEHGELLESLEIGDQQLQEIRSQLLSAVGSPGKMIGQGKKLFDRLR